MKHERKPIRVKALDSKGEGMAVFATFDVKDLDGDITERGAFGVQDVMVLPTHNWSSVPIGKGKTREVGDQAIVDFRMNLDTAPGRDWHAALKFDLQHGDPIQEWSYGFTITKAEPRVIDGEELRVLQALDVHEVSPVVLGAGMGTGTLAMKAAIENGDLSRDQLDNLARAMEPLLEKAAGRGSRKFADQITDAIGECKDILTRAQAIREERKRENRDLSPERIEQLKALHGELVEIGTLAKSIEDEIRGGEEDPEVESLIFADEVRKLRGSVGGLDLSKP